MSTSKTIERALFEGASSIDAPGEREEFLDQTCHGMPELRQRIEQLLRLRESADRFFEPGAAELQPPLQNENVAGISYSSVKSRKRLKINCNSFSKVAKS